MWNHRFVSFSLTVPLTHVVFTQEPLSKPHRYSTMAVCLSNRFPGGAHGGWAPCRGGQLFCGHTRLFNQDNSTVGRLTSEDIDKARNTKKTDNKQHKQVVFTSFTGLFMAAPAASVLRQCCVSAALELRVFFCFSSVNKPERGRCRSHA